MYHKTATSLQCLKHNLVGEESVQSMPKKITKLSPTVQKLKHI